MTTVGVAGFSGTALASACPRTPGYWATHDWCDVLVNPDDSTSNSVAFCFVVYSGAGDCPDQDAELANTGVFNDMGGWQEFLVEDTNGDKGTKMGQIVLATLLNFCRRPPDDDDCVEAELDLSAYGLGTTTIQDVKNRAVHWLEESDFPDRQSSWTVGGVDGEPLKDVLDDFMNGELDTPDALECDCPADD